MSLIGKVVERSESEVMTAMMKYGDEREANNDKDRFTATELAALRSDLLQGGMIDSYEAAELLQVFPDGPGIWGFAQGSFGCSGPRRNGRMRTTGSAA